MYYDLCFVGFVHTAAQYYTKTRANAEPHRKIQNSRKGDFYYVENKFV